MFAPVYFDHNATTPLDPAVSAGTKSTYQGGRGDAREDDSGGAIYITEPGLQSYLRGRFPEHGTVDRRL